MKLVITGATGFIGPTLVHHYNRTGYQVSILTRSMMTTKTKTVSYVNWDPSVPGDWEKEIDGADVVINLAGESVAQKWNDQVKESILKSRVQSTRALVQAIEKAAHKPKVFVNASAVGYYGDRDGDDLDENSTKGEGFLSDVCAQWEAEARKAEDFGVRTAIVRIGIVLEREGGALSKFIPPFKMFVGGPLGSGKQWMSWIHRDDLIRLIAFIIENKEARGVFNATAPNPVTMKEFAKTLGHVMGRPSLFPVPGFVLKLKMGQMADEMLLSGQKVLPKRAEEIGYQFEYGNLELALKTIFGKEKLKKHKRH